MIDETGKKAWEETFDLWGKPHDRLETRVVGGAILTNVKPREANKNQAISQPFRFPGQYHDEETGLYYNRFRYYLPGEGMYTQRDPIGLAGGNPTVYGYVRDTNIQIDPFGLNNAWETVGRWMSRGEYQEMLRNVRVVPSNSGTTFVAFPANHWSYFKQARNNTVYVEFSVPSDSIKITNKQEGWAKILGPNTPEARLAQKKGELVSFTDSMPEARDITLRGEKKNGQFICP